MRFADRSGLSLMARFCVRCVWGFSCKVDGWSLAAGTFVVRL